MVSFILGGRIGTLLPVPRVTLPRQPYSSCFPIVNTQFTKIRFRAKPYSTCFAHPQSSNILPAASSSSSSSSIDSRFDSIGRRVTIGDVVNKDALKSLQYEINGTIQVSGENVVYVVYPKYYLLKRTLKFLKIKAQSLLEKLKVAALFLWKVSSWASVSASSLAGLPVAVVLTLIFRVTSVLDASTLYLQLITEVFSGKVVKVVLYSAFGDGDPNQGIEKKRWKMIGQYIALNGGVVTAEEIAPYLDPQNTENMDDESYMLPVLQLFNGQPKVDEEGNILYHFPSVHCIPLPRNDCGKEYVGRWVDQDILVDKFLKEEEWEFRELSEESVGAYAILCYNILCSFIMWGASTMLRNVSRSYMSHIFIFLLKMYAVHFFSSIVFSIVTWCSMEKINDEITERNGARERHAKALEQPDPSIKRKLLSSRNMARKASIGNDRFVYKIENDLYEQEDYERQEWDRRFEMKIQD